VSASQEEVTVQRSEWIPEEPGETISRPALLTRMRASTNGTLRKFRKARKRLLRGCLEPVGCLAYVCRGRLPLTVGYREYRNRYVRNIIGNQEVLKLFDAGKALPANFGARLDERVVEYPWVLSRLGRYEEKLRALDAGSTLNYEEILHHPAVKKHKWSIVTLAPETESFWDEGISYLYEDLRTLPCKDDWFDAIACISTIEHVGMDNVLVTMEKNHRENRPQDFLRAVREMRRVLKPGGALFLTVPFGRYEHRGWLQQFDSSMLSALISEFRPQKAEKTFFRYTGQGWQLAAEEECVDLSFSDVIRNKHALRKDRVPGFPSDYAVAARAVACIELRS
jgi:SAM-dependent methyltransferase